MQQKHASWKHMCGQYYYYDCESWTVVKNDEKKTVYNKQNVCDKF